MEIPTDKLSVGDRIQIQHRNGVTRSGVIVEIIPETGRGPAVIQYKENMHRSPVFAAYPAYGDLISVVTAPYYAGYAKLILDPEDNKVKNVADPNSDDNDPSLETLGLVRACGCNLRERVAVITNYTSNAGKSGDVIVYCNASSKYNNPVCELAKEYPGNISYIYSYRDFLAVFFDNNNSFPPKCPDCSIQMVINFDDPYWGCTQNHVCLL